MSEAVNTIVLSVCDNSPAIAKKQPMILRQLDKCYICNLHLNTTQDGVTCGEQSCRDSLVEELQGGETRITKLEEMLGCANTEIEQQKLEIDELKQKVETVEEKREELLKWIRKMKNALKIFQDINTLMKDEVVEKA